MSILIVYATKYGSAEKCAKQLADKLDGQVELLNLREVKTADLSRYEKVIIGSSVYMGNMRKEAKAFIAKYLKELQDKPTGLFLCAMANGADAEKQLQACFPRELVEKAVATDTFGGELHFKRMNTAERFIIRMVGRSQMKKQGSSLIGDGKTDVSTISEDKVEQFARSMQAAV
ncbi:flavodoxin domain-containing protein [Gorillibacterium massiliense]|uniref:flavodoxin domain-containing protein n=1 Tax=Gorillibacterium massiliense TaxID=1280390 RepID=UPI0004AEE3B2|nr:flavodoxin domain-containing protein [Gorillibacterium massiliense]